MKFIILLTSCALFSNNGAAASNSEVCARLIAVTDLRAFKAGHESTQLEYRNTLTSLIENVELSTEVREEAFLTYLEYKINFQQMITTSIMRYNKYIDRFDVESRGRIDAKIMGNKELVDYATSWANSIDNFSNVEEMMNALNLPFVQIQERIFHEALTYHDPTLIKFLLAHEKASPSNRVVREAVFRDPTVFGDLLNERYFLTVLGDLAKPDANSAPQMALFKKLVGKLPDINQAFGSFEATILGWAIRNGDNKKVDWLLEQPHIDVNAPFNKGELPLNLAIRFLRPEFVRQLLARDANVLLSGQSKKNAVAQAYETVKYAKLEDRVIAEQMLSLVQDALAKIP